VEAAAELVTRPRHELAGVLLARATMAAFFA
jgi:hypothetical protein